MSLVADMYPMMPQSIQIGPMLLTVHALAAMSDNHAGTFKPADQGIHINPSYSEDYKAATLLHEVLHAIIHISGLGRRVEQGIEEELVSSLEYLLLDTLRRNPQLVDYLCRSDSANEA